MSWRANTIGVVAATMFAVGSMAQAAGADELKRRGMFGIQLSPVNEEIKENNKLPDTKGIFITGVVPNSAAQEAGVMANDCVSKIGGDTVTDFQHGLSLLRRYRAGDTVPLTVLRQGEEKTIPVTLRPRPKEEWTDFEVVYDSAGEPGKRVRTLLTKPKDEGKRPVVVLLPEPIPNSIEFMGQMNHPIKGLIERLTKAGYVTLRVERVGVGDSEGDDLSLYTVDADVAGFKAAIAKTKSLDFVDGDNIFVLAHGAGAALTPMVVRGSPVKGVITYAAIVRPLQDVVPEMLQRRWKIELVPEDEAKANMDRVKKFLDLFLVQGKLPADILKEHPDMKGPLERMETNDTFTFGMHYKQAKELAAVKSLPAWSEVTVPVLAVWGKSDYVADKKDSEMIVDAVKKSKSGKAAFQELAETDHMFAKAADAEESVLAGVGSLNPAVVELIDKWVKEQRAAGK